MLLISLELHNTFMKTHSNIYIYRLIHLFHELPLKVAGNGEICKVEKTNPASFTQAMGAAQQ